MRWDLVLYSILGVLVLVGLVWRFRHFWRAFRASDEGERSRDRFPDERGASALDLLLVLALAALLLAVVTGALEAPLMVRLLLVERGVQ